MKKIIFVILFIAIITSLCACGNSEKAQSSSQSSTETSANSTSVKKYTLAEGASWEIGEPMFTLYTSENVQFSYLAIPVTNTGEVDLFMKELAYTYKYPDGESETQLLGAFMLPRTIKPGERIWITADWNPPERAEEINGIIVKYMTAEIAQSELPVYPVSDILFSNEKKLTAQGVVENNTDSHAGPFFVRIFLYDSNGKLLGDLTSSSVITLEPGEKTTFTASSHGYADQVQASEIASYEVFCGTSSYVNN